MREALFHFYTATAVKGRKARWTSVVTAAKVEISCQIRVRLMRVTLPALSGTRPAGPSETVAAHDAEDPFVIVQHNDQPCYGALDWRRA